jgi:hypothetical protein
VQKIAELLVRDSQKNGCQYFVSSFKEDMMGFSDELCNYYMVSSEERKSKVEKVTRSRAIDAVRTITIRK